MSKILHVVLKESIVTLPRARNGMTNLYLSITRTGEANVLPLCGLCPTASTLTEFDIRNMALYTFLLVAEEDGAGLEELATTVLKFDVSRNRRWAIRVTLSYLQRARWVHDYLYPWLD